MLIIIIITICLGAIFLGYKLLGRWFNHLAIYSVVWMTMLSLFELRLIYFYPLSIYTWLVIIGAFLSLLFGSLTVILAREEEFKVVQLSSDKLELFSNNGRILKYFIYIFSVVGILSALQHWSVLLDKYGTVFNVLIHAYQIYGIRVSGELEGVIPYIYLIIYPAIFLAGIYTAYKNRLTLVAILPVIALILKEIANLSRAGILFGLSEFITSFVLFRYLLRKDGETSSKSKFKLAFGIGFVILLLIIGAGFIKSVRQATDTFKGTRGSLSKLEGNALISPSIYFYASSQVGVLNKFLEADKERWSFGSNTFFTFYSALSKFDLVEKPRIYQEGYFIPNWSNTGTFLREIYSDFGIAGIFIVPFILGLLCSFYWYKFHETGKLSHLIILTHLYIVITISFFVLIIRSPAWTIGGIFLLLLIPFIERIASRKLLTD